MVLPRIVGANDVRVAVAAAADVSTDCAIPESTGAARQANQLSAGMCSAYANCRRRRS